MKRKISTIFLFLVLLLTTIGTKINYSIANPSHLPPAPQLPFAYIRSDGSVEPQTLPIIKKGTMYTFTDNIFNFTLSIQSSNIVINGAGYILQGNRSGKGIFIADVNNVTIKNLKLQRFATAITLSESSHNQIIGNEITRSGIGITLRLASNNIIEDNTIFSNGQGVLFYDRCDYNHIIKNRISDNSDSGLWVEGTIPGTSDHISIIGNDFISNKRWGILLRSSTNSTIIGNNITQNKWGIELSGDASRDSLIVENNIGYNEDGIRFHCQFSGEIYHNNFLYNSRQALRSKITGVPFIWNFKEKGNYWTDYDGEDADSNGIGDTPYVINEENQDNYPLMFPAIPIIDSPQLVYAPILSMPKEYINYTISRKKGVLWAKIEGKYPINILGNSIKKQIDLPMVYPTPPNTTNIKITLNGQELNWSNYTQTYPESFHHTAIGDWPMIQCVIENVSNFFLLEIQYEHPIQQINGSHTFLYDLNISPYLSTQSQKSTAYFSICFEIPFSEIQIFTTETDTTWNPLDYASQINGSNTIITTQIDSKYLEPLLGDLVVSFNITKNSKVPNILPLVTFVIMSILVCGIFTLSKFRRRN